MHGRFEQSRVTKITGHVVLALLPEAIEAHKKAKLEEEKEELKEFQEKDKERRCLEYAMHQRELEEVGAALEEIEEERRGELHSANVRREQYTDREKQVQVSPFLPSCQVLV